MIKVLRINIPFDSLEKDLDFKSIVEISDSCKRQLLKLNLKFLAF